MRFHFPHSLLKPGLLFPFVCHFSHDIILPLMSFAPFNVFGDSRSFRKPGCLNFLLRLIEQPQPHRVVYFVIRDFKLLRQKQISLSFGFTYTVTSEQPSRFLCSIHIDSSQLLIFRADTPAIHPFSMMKAPAFSGSGYEFTFLTFCC